jgi:curved DNA-binding protein
MSEGSHYEVLGVSAEASADDIKKAFRKIAREHHPDVAGDNPTSAETFRQAREAYDVLSDPLRRAAYDVQRTRKPKRKAAQGRDARQDRGAFFRAFYKRASGGAGQPAGGAAAGGNPRHSHGERYTARRGSGAREDSMEPEDVFADFGFGAGAGSGESRYKTRSFEPQRGNDVVVELPIDASLARDGGIYTTHVARLRRKEGWKPGTPDPGVEPSREPVELDVPAGTKQAAVRRYRGLGDAGAWGGPSGDLVVRFRLRDDSRGTSDSARASAPRSGPTRSAASRITPRGTATTRQPPRTEVDGQVQTVDVTVAEALLGGRIEVSTPSGTVRVTLPPCTSSGRRLRLSGRGEGGVDLYLEVRIVAPSQLDAQSRQLIERFADLNPEVPER